MLSQQLLISVRGFPTINYDVFRGIQLNHKNEHNQKRSTVPIDLTDTRAKAKKKRRIEETNVAKKQGWRNVLP